MLEEFISNGSPTVLYLLQDIITFSMFISVHPANMLYLFVVCVHVCSQNMLCRSYFSSMCIIQLTNVVCLLHFMLLFTVCKLV